MSRFARLRLEDQGHEGGRADRALPRRLYAAAAARLERRLLEGELLAWWPPTRSSSASTSARSTRRSASPSPAPSLRCGRCGAGGRRGRGLALYIAGEDALDQFFCRHGRVPRPPGRGGDPRPVQRAAARRASALRRARGPLEDADAEIGDRWRAEFAATMVSAGDLRERPDRTFVPRRLSSRPPRSRCGRRAGTVSRSSTRPRAAARHRRHQARAHHRPRRRGVPARRAVVRGRRARPRGPARDRAPVLGDYYTQPKYETDTYIERLIERRTALGVTLRRSGPWW